MKISQNYNIVATFYKFVYLDNLYEMQKQLLQHCNNYLVKGTILLAHEGINGTLAGSRDAINRTSDYLKHDLGFSDIEHKESIYETMPFYRMKVKIKKEIVSMGIPGINPNKKVGIPVCSKEWNKLIEDPEVLVIDTRNQFEFDIGTFNNAISPNTRSFNEFPGFVNQQLKDYKNRKIAMFCTGGIRCEKATSYLLEQGFSDVYHLQGGILKYLEETNPDENLWQGECFVFDNRVAVDRNLEKGMHGICYGCRMPISPDDRKSPMYEPGISCPHCFAGLTEEQRRRFKERQNQVQLAEKRNQQHIGISIEEQKISRQ
jgi:UPF0176 protein